MSPEPIGKVAAAYAAKGWPVFPCRRSGKEPVTAHGYKDATCDDKQVGAWWPRGAMKNVAIATGERSGLVVLDVDPRNGGSETLLDLETEHGPLPPTPHVLTGGGGSHYYFAHPGGQVPSRALGPGLEI